MKKLSETLNELGIAFDFPIEIKNSDGNVTYYENSDGYWEKFEYDAKGNETYYETSNDFWSKREYDSDGNLTYCETSVGYKGGTPRSQTEGSQVKSESEYKRLEDTISELQLKFMDQSSEVLELRKDKERLDWLLKNCLIKELDLEWVHDSRETIDEAMKSKL